MPKDKWYCFSAKPKEDKVEGFTHRPKWTVTGAVANANACPAGFLPQYQASTFVPIYFETGNTFEKTYPGNGVTIPN